SLEGEREINNRRAVEIKAVTTDKQVTILLSFDLVNGLLLKKQFRLVDSSGKDTLWEEFYYDYKELDSIRLPSKRVTFLDGNKDRETMIKEMQFPERISDEVFANPDITLEKEARQILSKAVRAAGGQSELKKLQCVRLKMKGTIDLEGQNSRFDLEQSWRLP